VRGPIEASVSVMSELFLSKSGSSSGQTERDHLRWWWWTAQAEAEAGGQAGWQAGRPWTQKYKFGRVARRDRGPTAGGVGSPSFVAGQECWRMCEQSMK
jgi:hypothetical protein